MVSIERERGRGERRERGEEREERKREESTSRKCGARSGSPQLIMNIVIILNIEGNQRSHMEKRSHCKEKEEVQCWCW